ncbi:NAD(P)/FAD-dependent oxidoreductase [Amycolatopsis sp. cg5]|uniref:NAD(P)/FAD-dependent oxidoreductase n=1 Tax=Amycolatopsis sp. cg5 TaxID=3238802 RepID=UPI0035236C75
MKYAVVLGGGMGGLLAARVLAAHFDQVTIVERDTGDGARPRRGVPQGRHPHTVLQRTSQLLEGLFPGLHEEYAAAGAQRVGLLDEVRVRLYGHQLCRPPIGWEMLWASRPLLEHGVRARVTALPNVVLRQGWEAIAPIAPDPGRIAGVVVTARDGTRTESLPADLVVDATGRTPRSLSWLKDLGYAPPKEDRTRVKLAYASRVLRCADDVLDGDRMVAIGPVPERPQGMIFTVQEHGRWLLTVYGYGDHRPGADRFMEHVRAVAPGDVWEVVSAAEPLGEVSVFQFPETCRRRYESLSRFPAGLIVVGDALCSVNPIYGNGMLLAATQATILDRVLGQGLGSRGFFAAAARALAGPWWLGVISDANIPGVPGPPGASMAAGYVRRFVAAAAHDPVLATEFIKVVGAVRPPLSLVRPAFIARMLRSVRSG